MQSSKYSILIGCIMIFVLFMTGCSSNSTQAGNKSNESNNESKFLLKLATWTPAESHYTKHFFEPFMEKVTNLTDGRVQFEFYPGEQLGKGTDSLSLVSSGVADISLFSPDYTPSEMPLGAALIGMPGLFETPIQGATGYYEVAQQGPMLETDFLKNGVRPVSLSVTSLYEFFSNGKEIKLPEDLKGFKVRASGGVFTEALSYAGATPVSIGSSEIYNAFNSKVVDGLHYNYMSMDSFGLSELAKYATRGTTFGVGKMGLIINENLYQDLPQDIQEVIMQVGEEVGKSFTEYLAVNDDKIFESLKDSKDMIVHELSEAEKEQWKNFYNEFQEYYKEKLASEEFKIVLEKFNSAVKKIE